MTFARPCVTWALAKPFTVNRARPGIVVGRLGPAPALLRAQTLPPPSKTPATGRRGRLAIDGAGVSSVEGRLARFVLVWVVILLSSACRASLRNIRITRAGSGLPPSTGLSQHGPRSERVRVIRVTRALPRVPGPGRPAPRPGTSESQEGRAAAWSVAGWCVGYTHRIRRDAEAHRIRGG